MEEVNPVGVILNEEISGETLLKYLQEDNVVAPMKWLLTNTKPDESQSEEFPKGSLKKILTSPEFLNSEDQKKFLLEACTFTNEELASIALRTTAQFNNPLYCVMHQYRLTSSSFGKILKAIQRNSFPPSLFKSLLGNYDLTGVCIYIIFLN